MQAGEGGSSSFVVPATEDRPARWQTPRQRQLAQQSPFQLLGRPGIIPGVQADDASGAGLGLGDLLDRDSSPVRRGAAGSR